MKILRSIHSMNPAVGGPIESVNQSSATLIKRGHEVDVVTLDAPDAPWLADSRMKIFAVGPGHGSYGYTPGLPVWLAAHARDYDVVIVQGIWQWSSFAVWGALRETATPYFVFPHGMLDPWFNRTYPRKRVKKMLYWRWGEYRVLRDAAAVLFTSEEERRLARESFSPYHCNEVVVSYGTARPEIDLETARAKFFAEYPNLVGKRVLLFLSRLHEKKGADLLIDAFSRVSREASGEDVHLVVGGPPSDDAYHRRLQQSAAESSAAITFTGMLAGDMKWGALAAAEAFVLPSHQENFGIAVVEALACGTPVLISNKVNIWREIVEDGAGLADDDDSDGTSRLLAQWLSLPQHERDEMGRKAQASFDNRFDIARATDDLIDVMSRYAQ